ncbi:GmrSD restriction endonuclease domain-containing protein [Leeuwenhoekiella parthenopeia]|uniref:DUF262 domain-containing protein n=1 Tax=Leeuwenhoekiella parthenopeia TaxID=2890320 RepID=A0ABS8GT80_9FLAO|nr:DUF262 domain-containing protein [Leeuwenhoekiella parthenopeia]MCC4212958.1 DUF262 domain-containing protein [Leeuwenhoekiella parthenopeia]
MKLKFTNILADKVEIPIIQRDFAQGRTDKNTSKIRRDFLDAIFDTIIKNKEKVTHKNLELDFIYGNKTQGDKPIFSPIDGQQRLTVLWLLYWFVTSKESVPKEEKEALQNFVYETRHSTTIFCKKLIAFNPQFTSSCISDEIKNQSWYFETWDFDPSIQAMLVVLDDIEFRYDDYGLEDIWQVLKGENCPFEMYQLVLSEFKLSDDLYIKMNSRGKPLTEFEYFKANFSEIITDEELKQKFEKQIDQDWFDCIWNLLLETEEAKNVKDIALLVDNSFLNLFNFITYVIGLKNDIPYSDTVESSKELKNIYGNIDNVKELFSILDNLVISNETNPDFWRNTFYFDKASFHKDKTRLFFPHQVNNLLVRCLLYFDKDRGFSLPEQLLLHSYLFQNIHQTEDFERKLRIVRNLVVNSEFELRRETLVESITELETFLLSFDFDALKRFKTDQIQEEKEKEAFYQTQEALDTFYRLEDSDIFRGNISIFEFDDNAEHRASQFLKYFDEDVLIQDFSNRANFLLCFGDYTQHDSGNGERKEGWYNILSSNKKVIRKFFTTPGYGKKKDIFSHTRPVLMKCLDFLAEKPNTDIKEHINTVLESYEAKPKDWKYYFIKYPSFRWECSRGYYYSFDYYVFNKMRQKQFNGFNWCPFFYEVNRQVKSKKLILGDYNDLLFMKIKKNTISVNIASNHFLFENQNAEGVKNPIYDELIAYEVIDEEGILYIEQNAKGLDTEDRVVKLVDYINSILQKK